MTPGSIEALIESHVTLTHTRLQVLDPNGRELWRALYAASKIIRRGRNRLPSLRV